MSRSVTVLHLAFVQLTKFLLDLPPTLPQPFTLLLVHDHYSIERRET